MSDDVSGGWTEHLEAPQQPSDGTALGFDGARADWSGSLWATTDESVGPPDQSDKRPLEHGLRRRVNSLLVATLMLIGAVGGVIVGHLVWTATSARTSASTNNNFPSSQFPFGSGGFGFNGSPSSHSNFGGSSTTTPVNGAGSPADVSSIAAKIDPALVDINTSFNYQGASGAGTGIVLTSRGEVVTNNHVINGETSLSVTDVGNGKTYKATVVGYDDAKDLAVLQLQGASGLATATTASSTASVGEPVVAVGNAGGTGGTPTSAGGSITDLNQPISAYDDLNGSSEQLSGLIGIDADVQPGDSGGALVNASGRVIGIDTAASSGSSGSSSFQFSSPTSTSQGFAIPIEEALNLASQIESGQGSTTVHVGPTAFLGLSITTDQSAGQDGYPGSQNTTAPAGASILRVTSGSAGDRVGLVAGDVITALDGHEVSSPAELTGALVSLHPGDHVSIHWTDPSGKAHEATVTLGSGPPA